MDEIPYAGAASAARFAFRPEVNLLYDRRNGIEHHLDAVAVDFVRATLSSESGAETVARLKGLYAASDEVLTADLESLWTAMLAIKRNGAPKRRGGGPLEWMSAALDFPLALEIELTKICNWNCDFCYNVWKIEPNYTPSSDDRHLPLERVRQILDEAARANCLRVRFSGGEPSLHPQFREIIELACSYDFDVELFTNGSRMSKELVQHFAALGLRVMLVSLHGREDTHKRMAANRGAYAHAIGAMAAARQAGITVIAEMLVCEENIGEVSQVLEQLREIDVQHLSLMPYVAYGEADKRRTVDLRRVADLIASLEAAGRLKSADTIRVPCAPKHCLSEEPQMPDTAAPDAFDNHCAAGSLWASVSYDGRVRHCPHSNAYAGSIETGIGILWREKIVPTVREAILPRSSACSGCAQFAACRGGCHLNRVIY